MIFYTSLLLLLSIRHVSSAAIPSNGTARFDKVIQSIVRRSGEPDVVHPIVCPAVCNNLHDPLPNITKTIAIPNECACACPNNKPAFSNSVGSCIDKLPECMYTIRWRSRVESETIIPVVHLFPHSVVLPNTPLDWNGAGIIVSSEGRASCELNHVFYENIHHKWKMPPRKTVLFELTDFNKKPIIYFRGTDFDASFLTGALVEMKLKCETYSRADVEFCVSIRIAGISGSVGYLDNGSSNLINDSGWRIEIILLFAFVTFIVITLLITLIIWNICWKIKKRKLISDFQMQFIQQYRRQNGNDKTNAQLSIEGIEIEEDVITPSSNRRRLYFSAEYFDPELFENPPPMAEQFLYDLRRMVDTAMDRIRQRRFMPILETITEEEECKVGGISVEMKANEAMISSQESSPRSEAKSVDSGRESREDSEEDEENRKSEDEQIADKKVSDIVKNFEKSISKPSQLPILHNSSIRRKSSSGSEIPKLSRLPTPATKTISERRNELESRIRPPTGFNGRSLKEKIGAYAVFPSDATFNKSLPRRPKRLTPPNPTIPIS